MNSTSARIRLVAVALGMAFLVVAVHLYRLMVGEHEVWAARSHENRWAFRAVPAVRGALRDRHGLLLAYDEPTTELTLFYQRFRLFHPVGAAVHGATLWARLQPGGEGTTYGYTDGVLGPDVAIRDLLQVPVAALRPGRLAKGPAAELGTLATTVLASASGLPRKRVFAAMRTAAAADDGRRLGDVLPDLGIEAIERKLQERLVALRQFDAELTQLAPSRQPELFPELERLRRASLAGQRVERRGADGQPLLDAEGQPVLGDPIETIAWPFVDRVPFDLAASLRVGPERHPGIGVEPSVVRIAAEPAGTSLRGLLGIVRDVSSSDASTSWLADYVWRELPEDWLDTLVPAEAAPNEGERERMQDDAVRTFARVLLRGERRGISGLEAAFDGELTGRLGMRLVERDVRARELQLWSSLRVEQGGDVVTTLDLGLQRVAQRLVDAAQANEAARHATADDAGRVAAALAVIDARSGDILAMAGAPVGGNHPRSVPGISWDGNGAIGSVLKPFVLLEQLQSEAQGRPCRAITDFAPCNSQFPFGGQVHRCGHAHGSEGQDPVRAVAESCNLFFYQAAVGLGVDGVRRALRRAGLLAPADPSDPFAACWQERLPGLPRVAPRWVGQEALPKRAIGYGVEASPLDVARGYAAIATGALPTLGIRRGPTRPRVPWPDLDVELAIVREGLSHCVLDGTADAVEALGRFAVSGKTGTAEVGERDRENNAWFAGYLPWVGQDGSQLCFCSVIYWVRDGVHGGEAAAGMVGDLLEAMHRDSELAARYLMPGGGR